MSPQKNYTGNALLTEYKPSLLRVDVLNFWGQPVVAFLMNEQEIKLMIYPESKLYRGPANSTNLSRFIPLPVSIKDFMAILTGRIAFEQYEKPVLLETKDPNVYYLELTSRGGNDRVKLTIESQSLNIISAQWLNSQGQEIMQAEFSEFTSQGTITGPREIKLASGDQVNQVRVRYRDLTYNVAPAPEALDITGFRCDPGTCLSTMKFLVDQTLGGLSKWLRLLGFDVVQIRLTPQESNLPDPKRDTYILTRQTSLPAKLGRSDLVILESDRPEEQLTEICRRSASVP